MFSRTFTLVALGLLASGGVSRAVDPPRFGQVPFTPFNGQVVARGKLDDRPAIHLARFARSVTIVVRPTICALLSSYQIS